jgi:hypothetical protein
MRALLVHQAVTPRLVAKQDKLLAEHFDQLRHIFHFAGQRDRLPVTAQVFTAGRSFRVVFTDVSVMARSKK